MSLFENIILLIKSATTAAAGAASYYFPKMYSECFIFAVYSLGYSDILIFHPIFPGTLKSQMMKVPIFNTKKKENNRIIQHF